MLQKSLKQVQEEIAKCECICANCHSVHHYEERILLEADRQDEEQGYNELEDFDVEDLTRSPTAEANALEHYRCQFKSDRAYQVMKKWLCKIIGHTKLRRTVDELASRIQAIVSVADAS